MTLKIDDYELELIYSFRSNIYFEQITGRPVDFSKMNSEDLLTLFFAVFTSSLQKAKKPIIPMLEFMDIIDANGGEKCFVEFTNWYVKTITAQYENLIDEKEPIKKKKKKTTN